MRQAAFISRAKSKDNNSGGIVSSTTSKHSGCKESYEGGAKERSDSLIFAKAHTQFTRTNAIKRAQKIPLEDNYIA